MAALSAAFVASSQRARRAGRHDSTYPRSEVELQSDLDDLAGRYPKVAVRGDGVAHEVCEEGFRQRSHASSLGGEQTIAPEVVRDGRRVEIEIEALRCQLEHRRYTRRFHET